ncbi:hypothetical protein JQ634_00280 [Bradyrhizobium sp. AUGA SZCCT0240]|uniref:hypothetical protein n=1 Tax=unclassified Bradyrhizobium TaxID=2631580 RepID=UPI001BAD33E1|nr:hypothetical protein [Bradyrhizobium sp. AUGA SZCCT0158]MBR1240843.1 hypothetical protein [Bradyrhizobium sp. AUGA SZCCT0274]MBR1252133.1 hypothetical protein [Bradyrhizobium sp. AUGA SZCCT0240]
MLGFFLGRLVRFRLLFGRFATLAELLLGARFAVGRGLRRLAIGRPCGIGRLLARPSLAVASGALRREAIGVGPGCLLRRGGMLPTAGLIRPGSLLLGALCRIGLRLILALKARVGRAIRYQERSEHPGHLAAGGVVLAQEAGQRRRRHVLQQAARALVAGGAGA